MARELGLISCAEMVQAFLDDRKSETRRIEALRAINEQPGDWAFAEWIDPGVALFEHRNGIDFIRIKPRYQVGDHLYAKETWAVTRLEGIIPGSLEYPNVLYRADSSTLLILDQPLVWKYCIPKEEMRWRSSRFMPKKFARIWREVTEVKDPHRLQDISPEECIAEGIEVSTAHGEPAYYLYDERLHYTPSPVESFQTLWDRLHPEPGERWGDNPWVLPYVLKIQEKPI